MAKNAQPAANAGTNQGDSPKTAAMTGAGPTTTTENTRGLEVISSRDGFRRAGFAWSKKPTIVPLDQLSEEQVQQLKDEPALTVREVDMPAPADASTESEAQ